MLTSANNVITTLWPCAINFEFAYEYKMLDLCCNVVSYPLIEIILYVHCKLFKCVGAFCAVQKIICKPQTLEEGDTRQ